MTNSTRSQFISRTSFSLNTAITLTFKHRKFSSKNNINKKVFTCNIKSVNHYINLNQPLKSIT